MAKNVVEITVVGVDEITNIIRDIEGNAEKSFNNIENAINSIPDIDIDTNIDTSQAETQFENIESAVNEVENSIKSFPDPDIDSSKAQGDLQEIESTVNEVESAILSLPDPNVNASRAEKELSGIEGAAKQAEGSIKAIPDPKIDGKKAESALDRISKKADEVKDSLEDIDFDAVLGGLVAGGGIAGAVEKALDRASLDTQIEISFNIPKESMKAVRQSIKTIESYGIDAEDALEGVRRQFALNANASDEANQKIIRGAGAVAAAYNEIDFTELIQEVNEVASELKISDEEALGLMNSLLKIGFPPGELDIIAEYGQQLQRAGYDAQEIQSIMAAGVETGTWNIDNLLDGLKEGRILLAEFGLEVDDSMKELLEGTGISAKQLQEWGQAVASGGEAGKRAMVEVAQALNNVEDSTKRNELGVKLFGTMWEDQGQNIIDTILNAEKATVSLDENTKGVSETVKTIDASPAVQMRQAFNELNSALGPLYSMIANFVSTIAGWIKENPRLAATIMAIATVIAIITGIFAALAPIVTAVTSVMGLLGVSFTALAGPVLIVIGVIAALIAIVVLLWKNWDSIVNFLSASWQWLMNLGSTVFNAIRQAISTAWQFILSVTTAIWNGIKAFFSTIWNAIRTVFTTALNVVRNVVTTVFNAIRSFITTIWNGIKTVTSNVWNTIVSVVTTIITRLRNGIQNVFNVIRSAILTVWNAVKNTTSNIWNGIRNTVSNIINGIRSTISRVFNGIRSTITRVWNGIKSTTSRIWNGIVGTIRGAINGVIGVINGMIGALNRIKIRLPKIPDWVPGIGGRGGNTIGFNIPRVPTLATGGLAVDETLAIIGEGADDEAVIPLNRSVLSQIGEKIGQFTGDGESNSLENKTIIELLKEIVRLLRINQDTDSETFRGLFEGATIYVRSDDDIQQIAREIYQLVRRNRRGSGLV